MRRGSQDAKVITSPVMETETGKSGGQIIGVSLGWDLVSEHEWGISGILQAFGIPDLNRSTVGADSCTITEVPKTLRFFDNLGGYSYLMFPGLHDWEESELTPSNFDRMLRCYRNDDFSTAWDEKSFGARLKNDGVIDAGKAVLGQIHDAFTKLDAMIFFGGRVNQLGNRGLVLAIRSRLSAISLKAMTDVDEDYLNLTDAVEETSIKQKLESAGKSYFALSPRWLPEDSERKTEYPVIFWLNPQEQHLNNSGWFTVEELLEWIDGKGPIPQKPAD